MRYWTQDEIALLQTPMPLREIAQQLDRSVHACASRRRALHSRPSVCVLKPWSVEEDCALAQILHAQPLKDAAGALGRTYVAIKRRAAKLKLAYPRADAWTRAEVSRLYVLAERTTQERAAKDLGKTLLAVKTKCHRLGLLWLAGYTTAADLARETGYSPGGMSRYLARVYPDLRPARGCTWRLTDEEADAIRLQFPRTRNALRAAGRL